MTIPNIPTDNLYKFMTTVGLILVITAFVVVICGILLRFGFGDTILPRISYTEKSSSLQEETLNQSLVNPTLKISDLHPYLLIALILVTTSCYLTGNVFLFAGIFGWHKNVQKHEDLLLKYKVELFRQEVEKGNKRNKRKK